MTDTRERLCVQLLVLLHGAASGNQSDHPTGMDGPEPRGKNPILGREIGEPKHKELSFT